MNIFSIILLPVALLNFFLALYSLKYRKNSLAIYSFGFLLSVAIYAYGYARELSSASLRDMLFWWHFEYVGITFLPTFWFLLVVYFAGWERYFTGWFGFVGFGFSAFMLIVVFTNQFHGHFMHSPYIDYNAPVPLLKFTRGVWYWFQQAYTMLSLASSLFLLIKGMGSSGKTYPRQAWVMFSGAIVPIIIYIIYIAGGSPYGIDLCPFSFSLVAATFAIALFIFKLLDFVPPSLEHVIHNLSEGLIIIDNKFRITHINKIIPHLFPYIGYRDIGEKILEKFQNFPDVCSLISDPSNNLIETNIYVKKQIRHYTVSSTSFSNNKNQPLGKIIVFSDITERKQTELSLREANASKDRFLSIIAHDLKNPFNVLINMSELLLAENTLTDEERKTFICSINTVSRNTHELLSDLLTWAMAQRDQISFKPEKIDLFEVFSIVTHQLNMVADNKNISIKSKLNTSLHINADKNMIQTILRNLLTNAIKFSDKNSVITINAVQKSNTVTISVTDHGIGMTDEDVKKLFRIDVKNNQIGNSKEKGTGLGLIICNEFVKKHNGHIWVESQANKGSTFYFSIPLKN